MNSLSTGLPSEFVRQMQHLLGDEWRLLSVALQTELPLRALRLHRWSVKPVTGGLRTAYALSEAAQLPTDIRQQFGETVPWSDDAFYIASDSTLGKSIYHEVGAFYIQEPSAMAVVEAMAVRPGERVLDLCAAPGGKSTALGRAMRGQGVLVANEIHPNRVLTLAQNVERLGIPATVVNESPGRLSTKWPMYFDAVLVDAPCSGEGMFRKDPAAREEWNEESPVLCAARQKEILADAVQMVRKGGRLVYSTCTLNPIENEQVVAWALRELPVQLAPLPNWPGWSEGRPEWAGDVADLRLTRRLWPHIGRGEGHFVAAFSVTQTFEEPLFQSVPDVQDRAFKTSRRRRPQKTGENRDTTVNDSDRNRWLDLAQELFIEVPTEWQHPVRYKDLLFAAPPQDLDISHLRVLRPALCLAQVKKERLEPHHNLAMAVHHSLVRHRTQVSPEDAAAYMSGLPLGEAETQGWNWLVTGDWLPIGWGKAVPGRINNAYPRGLRRPHLLT